MSKNFLLAILIAFFVGVAGTGYFFISSLSGQSGNTVALGSFGWKFPISQIKLPTTGSSANQVAFSSIRDPGGIPRGLPVRLKIPIIGVNTAIEDALITPDGRMDVPEGSVNVAWFALGPHPGQVGSAVIGGHFGIDRGVKFVFYDLDKLKIGDKAYIEDDEGNTLAFQVRTIKLFGRNDDATEVFTSNDGLAHLNVITCEGIWNQVNGTYPSRRVVFMDAIPSEGAVAVNPVTTIPVPAIPNPVTLLNKTLSIGARGADVVTLQNTLVQKGFLKISSGVADGSFGPVTRAAVIKYQTSIGLTATGIFDTATRARLNSDLAAVNPPFPIAAKPTLPSTAITTSGTSPTFYQNLESLFATPRDTAVTSSLLIAIIFTIIKIIL